jgi:hypothetical protein
MNTQTFSAIIEGVVKEKRITYLDAVVWYCEQKGVEIETGAKLVNSIIKKKVKVVTYIPSNKELEEVQEFLDYWDRRGVDLPSPINYPKCFLYYVKLWKYYNRDK